MSKPRELKSKKMLVADYLPYVDGEIVVPMNHIQIVYNDLFYGHQMIFAYLAHLN